LEKTMPSLARLMFTLWICLLLNPAHAAPAPPDLLVPGGWHLVAPDPKNAALQEHSEPGGTVETLTISTPSQPFYLEQIVRGIPAAVPAGHLLRLRFEARSATQNPVRVTVEQNAPPYAAALELSTTLTPQWKAFTLTGTSPGYGPNGLTAHFQAGQQAGVIELRQMTLTDLGLDPAIASANAALKPDAIQARIQKYRMGSLTIHAVGSDGRPDRNAQVEITQTRHAFLFGCNVFGYDPADASPAQKAYQNQFAALFNYATLPFYWGAFEPKPGKQNYAKLQAMADWCHAHGITPKGHPLVWHEVWPSWAPQTPDAAIPLLHARVTDLITHYHASIHFWDVVNEANAAASLSPPNGESEWIKRDGPAPVVETALGWARAAGQGAPETFLYNDYDVGSANVALLTQLQQDGKLPDVIGLQSHMHSGVWPLPKIWTVCQRFSQFGKPIHFTETTVLSGPNRTVDFNGPYPNDWNTTPDGEAAQADYVAQFYTILFSHPNLRAITWWDFSDNNAWLNAPAGLLRKDMTPKPAYTRLMTLIHKTWWTHLSGQTNRAGTVTQRVFYGEYLITVRDNKGRIGTQTLFYPEAAGPRSITIRVPSQKRS
jgi:endo-1,4-beta-xylanase